MYWFHNTLFSANLQTHTATIRLTFAYTGYTRSGSDIQLIIKLIQLYKDHPEKNCRNCGKELHGRSDQVFCNDTCRNTYNRGKRRESQGSLDPYIAKVIRVIQRNHQIMIRYMPGGEPRVISRYELIDAGFHFKYFTSISITRKQEIYHYCFDRGWKELENGKILLVFSFEQLEI
ncbi:hypothetical protein GS399_05580 [Pedobacter sp. HMF7647]|uniref:DUF2116 family Zn-ribbon domain-containing protein n=1 Tax=Hufsiella arboris TaxID=2695275 RepID=A0A7K1Y794_9SPHI|nr:hypothetical protein [Hufsiella arboris]MXV50437.1 hypothetical protein [Hufsiella arboris]